MAATPTRVLHVGMEWPGDVPGGLNRYVADLVDAQDAAASGSAHALVLGPATGAPTSAVVVTDHRAGLASRLLAFARAAAHARSTTDVLDGHFALYTAAAMVGRRGRGPLVVHFHGPWAEEGAAAGHGRLRFRARRALERAVTRRAGSVVTMSWAFRRLACEHADADPFRTRTIHPAVDLARFTPGDRAAARASLGLDADAFVAVTARRLVPRTGVDVLVDAWAMLDRRAGDRLLVAGDGPERAALEARAHAGGLDGTVSFLGQVDDDTLVSAYRAADVAVVPTRSLEGFGLVVLEALACGTPVVATDVGGLVEALAGFDAGLVPPGEAPALAGALARRRDAAAAPAQPSPEACRAHAERFSWAHVAAAHEPVYAAVRAPAARGPRLVIFGHSAAPSGAELLLLRVAPALGVPVHIVLGEDGPLVELAEHARISVEVLPLGDDVTAVRRTELGGGLPAGPALRAGAAVLRVARRLRRLRPDGVVLWSLKAGIVGAPAARLAGVPSVWTVHDRLAVDYMPAASIRLVEAMLRMTRGAVVFSDAVAATLPPTVRAMRMTPPVAGDLPAADPGAPGPLRVLMLGRLAPWKGQDVAMRAFAAAFPDGDEELHLVGAAMFADEAYERELRTLADRLGLGDRITFHGFRDDVRPFLAASHVLVHASVVPEPYGQVVAEGMASGLAVVAARAGGPAEQIVDGMTGVLYTPGDVDALAATLRALRDDPARRARLGRAARAAIGPATADVLGPDLARAYLGLLGCAAPAPATATAPAGIAAPATTLAEVTVA